MAVDTVRAGFRRRVGRAGRRTIAVAAGALAVATAAATGAVVTGLFAPGIGGGPPMPPLAAAGRPVVEQVAVGSDHVRVVVVPHRPGPNLVWVDGADLLVGAAGRDPVPAQRRPGAPGGWAVIDLPTGPSTLWVSRGERRAGIVVEPDSGVPALPGLTTAAGPECLSAIVGAAMVGAATPNRCPDQRLTAADRGSLRAMVRSIAERGVPGIRLIGGESPRASAAAAVVHRQAREVGLPVDAGRDPLDATVVVADWASAEHALIAQVRDPAGSGVYLAPWLANGTLLGYSSGAVVVLNYDTTEGAAADYVAALDAYAARELASPSGFTTWLAATGRPAPAGPTRLYASLAGFSLMGADPAMHGGGQAGHGMAAGTGGWIPNGRMTTVSRPLDPS